MVFAPNDVRGVKLGRLVQSPLQKFAHLTGRDGNLTSHLSTKFHEDSIACAQAFRGTMSSKAGDVAQQRKSAVVLQLVKNRSALQRIVLCVEYLGRLGIPLRGHRDSGHLQLRLGHMASITIRVI